MMRLAAAPMGGGLSAVDTALSRFLVCIRRLSHERVNCRFFGRTLMFHVPQVLTHWELKMTMIRCVLAAASLAACMVLTGSGVANADDGFQVSSSNVIEWECIDC
ncbi:hypothetical protein ACFV94_36200 [Streptomyces sp. NPDC059896]|uniref:hypothetical protein n=1 Tax=Streptomyces sp. NPDC059896 TaxID=3346993 RepID=UPI003646A319